MNLKYLSIKKILALVPLFFIVTTGIATAAPLSNNPAADYVIGQSNFTSSDVNTLPGGLTFQPTALAVDAIHHRLFVADTNNQRVLIYDTSSGITNTSTPVHVLGQPDFTTNGGLSTITASNMQPEGLAYDSVHDRLFVADANRHRVLVFDTSSITDNMPAIHVLGQSTMTDGICNRNSNRDINTLCFKDDLRPVGLAYDSVQDRLFVTDIQNQRLMVFNTATITDGEDASHVIGQPDFINGGSSAGLNDQGFNYPYGIAFDSGNQLLYVTSNVQSRVLVFNTSTLTDFPHASYVIGQPDFVTNNSSASINGFDTPADVVLDTSLHRLYVADSGNNRIMVYNTTNLSNGMDASYVIGQPDFTTKNHNSQGVEVPGPKGSSFLPCAKCTNGPAGLAFDNSNNFLYVSDVGNNRLLAYDFSTPVTPKTVTYSGSFTESVNNDGSVTGSRTATLSGDTFTNSGSTLTLGTDYTLSPIPSGLTPTLVINGSGTTATLTFSGNAIHHEAVDTVNTLTITFNNSAFTGSNASAITGSTDTNGSITFHDTPVSTPPSSGSTGRYTHYSFESSTPEQILGSGTCPAQLLINDFMKIMDRDGSVNRITKKKTRDVALLQKHINRILAAQYNQAAGPVDGIFGNKTKQGVMRLQTALNTILKPNQPLVIDGIVGPYTKAAINNSCGTQ